MATALILFTQGANTDSAGKAVLGDYGDFSTVTVTNGSNTGVVSWKIYLLDAPPDSVSFPPASQPQILAQAVDNTPTVDFTPDVAGTYRVMLEVTDGVGSVDRDIRCFGIPDERGFVHPPYQQNPEPLPLALPGIITRDPRPIKPDEQNYGTNVRGWSGSGTADQLDSFFRKYGDLPFQVVSTTPFTATLTGPPLYLVDVVTIGGAATFNLPSSPRVGFVVRIAVLGPPGDAVTVQAAGNVGSGATIDLVGDTGVVLVHQGANAWAILTSLGSGSGATPFSNVQYVDFGTLGAIPDGTVVNPFPAIMDAVNAGTGGIIYLTPANYSAETLNFTGKFIELIAMGATPLYGGPFLSNITTDNFLSLTNVGESTGAIASTAMVYLSNVRIDGAIQALSLIAVAHPDINSLCLLGGAILCDASVVIDGYQVSSSVTSNGGDIKLLHSGVNGEINAGAGLVAQDCTFNADINATGGAPSTVTLTNCEFTSPSAIVFTTAGTLRVDAFTHRNMIDVGVTVTNATTVVIATVGPDNLAVETPLPAVGVVFSIRIEFTAGDGSADDITIYSTDAPFDFRILDALTLIFTAVAGTIQVRTAAAGGGAALTSALSTASTGTVHNNTTGTSSVTAGGSAFAHRTSSSSAGELILFCVRT